MPEYDSNGWSNEGYGEPAVPPVPYPVYRPTPSAPVLYRYYRTPSGGLYQTDGSGSPDPMAGLGAFMGSGEAMVFSAVDKISGTALKIFCLILAIIIAKRLLGMVSSK